MKRLPKWHRVDRHEAFVSQHDHDHLEEVASHVGPDRQLPRRVTIRIEIDHHQQVIERMADRFVADPVPPSGTMDLHTPLV